MNLKQTQAKMYLLQVQISNKIQQKKKNNYKNE